MDHQPPSFDVAAGSNFAWTPTPQEYPPLGDGSNTSQSTDTIPGLTNSIPTVSDFSETEITGPDNFEMEFAQMTEMEKQASFSPSWS